MPLVAHNELPTFDKLRQEGLRVLTPDTADVQDIRELHIGLLNVHGGAQKLVRTLKKSVYLSAPT